MLQQAVPVAHHLPVDPAEETLRPCKVVLGPLSLGAHREGQGMGDLEGDLGVPVALEDLRGLLAHALVGRVLFLEQEIAERLGGHALLRKRSHGQKMREIGDVLPVLLRQAAALEGARGNGLGLSGDLLRVLPVVHGGPQLPARDRDQV
jgi:hypothetical protein